MHPPSCTALFPFSYPTTFSFYINSLLYGEIPAGQVMIGKMVPKMDLFPTCILPIPSIAEISAEEMQI